MRADVEDLAARIAGVDGVYPLNEEALLALGQDGEQPDDPHHLSYCDHDLLVGYLQFQPRFGTAQLLVDPAYRRQGIGTRVLTHARLPDTWAFGNTPAAQGFAARMGMAPARELLIMERPLDGLPTAAGDSALSIRGFHPEDEADFLALNAAAFATHPEQGQLDSIGFHARMAESWFDPEGLLLGFDSEGLAGFHWTKRQDDEAGEVYVLGVAPRAQGRGYGKALLQAGLRHLRQAGCAKAVLFVDGGEDRAV
ncbi:MAG: mycothiol synthase, partial [Propionibacteriaceae bacterium]|nr:mycothiol synthase [Propionibacteriaceae bacterium]